MRYCLCFLVFGLLVSIALAAAPPPARHEKWTIDDVIDQESVQDIQISPDGRFALWVKSIPDKEKNEAIGHIHRTDLVRQREVQLTRGKESCTSPRWSPDGSHIAFLSSRPAPEGKEKKKKEEDEPHPQLWGLDASGGEPWPLTELSRGVQHFDWAGNEEIVFTAQEEPTYRENTLKEDKKDDTQIVEDEKHEPPVRLFRVALDTKKITRLSNNRDRIEQLAVSPDGRFAAALHGRSLQYTYDNKIKPVVYLHDLHTGSSRQVLNGGPFHLQSLHWSPDGTGFYATQMYSSKSELNQAGIIRVYWHDLKSDKDTLVDLAWPAGLATQDDNGDGPGLVPVDGGFLALLADGVRHRLARYQRQGEKLSRQWLSGEHAGNIFGLGASRDARTIVYAHSTACTPTRWYQAHLKASGRLEKPRVLTGYNEHMRDRRKARAEIIHWKGARGERVEGILFYPHDYRPGRPAPLVVQPHGGPAAADLDSWSERWSYSANLVCQRGAFVLKPNYHGSSNYGLSWVESISDGRYCDPELEDIEKGVDELIARGLVDGKRLALSGWSNGAILTNQLIAHTTRYRAAVAGAGSIEFVSDWASCEFGEAFDRFYLGKSPLEDVKLYVRKSPFYRLEQVRTPTLILFGSEDRVVHPQQGWAQYRAMQQLGKAPVRFVLFPGARHGPTKLSQQRRKLQEEFAWLDRYLFDRPGETDVPVKEDSPLHWLLERHKAQRVANLYGRTHAGVLVPETVKFGALDVGRFEVTRAQIARFDPNYRLEPGTENHPASGIGYEQARAYCRWLTKLTGKRYRLPNEAEAEKLYEESGEGENTLDRWAGYTVNPEDAEKLRAKMKDLPEGVLLQGVGSGRGTGKGELVYDLGGNVAEWIEGKEGRGELRGGSADVPADSKGQRSQAGRSYQGFRVVLD